MKKTKKNIYQFILLLSTKAWARKEAIKRSRWQKKEPLKTFNLQRCTTRHTFACAPIKCAPVRAIKPALIS